METERKHVEARFNETRSVIRKIRATGLVEALKQVALSLGVVSIALIIMSFAIDLFVAYPPTKHAYYQQRLTILAIGLIITIIVLGGIYEIATLRRNLQSKWMKIAEAKLREKEASFFEKIESDLQALMSRRP